MILNSRAEIIVDIGCGSGNVTQLLANSIFHDKVYAFDFDPKMVEYATKNYNKDGTIEYFTQDIGVPWSRLDDKLRQLEGKVDIVWSNRVLHWVRDKKTAIKTISRLLKPGGRCYINITFMRDLHEFYSQHEREKAEMFMKFYSFDLKNMLWKKRFNDCGLSQVNVEFMEKKIT